MLGHARLNTTEIYTHVNIQMLIEVHRLTHPAKLPQNVPAVPTVPARPATQHEAVLENGPDRW